MSNKKQKIIEDFFQPKKNLLTEMVEKEVSEALENPTQLAQMRVVANDLENISFKAEKAAKLQRSLIGDESLQEIVGVAPEQVPIVIDLGAAAGGQLNESWLYMLGGWIETLLGGLFGMNGIPVTIKGTKGQVESFARTMQGEKRYIDAWRQYGLDDARTHASKAQLDNAIKGFESRTGIKYPFK